jgi:hypothetical protein
MNTIDSAMIAILEKRLALSKLSYSDDTYDDVEELLHDLEDDFNEKYGDKLEEILEKVHLAHCPESDVLLPTAYLAKKFVETGALRKLNGGGVAHAGYAFSMASSIDHKISSLNCRMSSARSCCARVVK